MSADLVPTRHNNMVKEACLLFFSVGRFCGREPNNSEKKNPATN